MSLVRSNPMLSKMLFAPQDKERGFSPDDVLRDLGFPNPNPMLVANVPPEPANQFKVMLYLRHFIPEKMRVILNDRVLTVTGSHNIRLDKHGHVEREFTRKIPVPIDVDETAISSIFLPNGILVIKGPRVSEGVPGSDVREVPIQLQSQIRDFTSKGVIILDPRRTGLM